MLADERVEGWGSTSRNQRGVNIKQAAAQVCNDDRRTNA